MKPKKIHNSDITGQKGINLIERVLLDMGFLWYPTGGVEAGVDGWIEIRDSLSGEVLNSIIQVQSKATANPFQAETDDSFQFLCDERDLDYWLRGNAPVILVVSRPNSGEAYWVSIKDYFSDPARRKGRKLLFDKKANRFDVNCKPALMSLSIPADAGIYFAPPPKQESLYSNLLPVTRFFEHIYAADTECRTPGELRAALKQHEEYPSNIWLLKDKRLYSPHNLSEVPWKHACDVSTMEIIDAKHWAYSTDESRRRDFVILLNESLKDKVGAMRIRYNRLQNCYYFKADKGPSQRSYRYLSQQVMTKRMVVTRYSSSNNPDIVWYRHCAFAGRFKLYEGVWYLEISPTYYFSTDGILPWRFYEEWLSGIKRRQKNHAVLGEVIMWARVLEEPRDMFGRKHPFLGFGDLQTYSVDAGIHDELWLPSEQAIQAEKDPDPNPSLALSKQDGAEKAVVGTQDGADLMDELDEIEGPRQLPFRFN